MVRSMRPSRKKQLKRKKKEFDDLDGPLAEFGSGQKEGGVANISDAR